MSNTRRTYCWSPTWNPHRPKVGVEHLLLASRSAQSVVVGFDEQLGPFRLDYRLAWDDVWRLRTADLVVVTERRTRALELASDGRCKWWCREGQTSDGVVSWESKAQRPADELEGCLDIDIWPTPFTNTFPIRRERLAIGERKELRMVWVNALEMSVRPQAQAYTRIEERVYLFESLDGSGFKASLAVDDEGVVLDYPGLFLRVHEAP